MTPGPVRHAADRGAASRHHGALANWVEMQHHYDCFFFIADWHALTTGYEDTGALAAHPRVLVDWLAAGVDPSQAMFIQSKVPEHAELHLLLSMATPLGWLERVPTYKDQIDNLSSKDLATYGFLGYPLLQAADVLIYRASQVPVGDDQVPHIEMMREIARRFNGIYGREADSRRCRRLPQHSTVRTGRSVMPPCAVLDGTKNGIKLLRRGRWCVGAGLSSSTSDCWARRGGGRAILRNRRCC